MDETDAIDRANEKSHVRPEMRDFLDIDGRQRLYKSWDKIWIPTSKAKEAFRLMTDCMNAPLMSKPRGLVLTGDSDTGKSRTMEVFRSKFPPVDEEGFEYAHIPVVYIKAPNKPDQILIYKLILAELGQPALSNDKESALRENTLFMMKKCRVGVVMIDEIHDVVRARMTSTFLEFIRFLKNLINASGRPFILGGVDVVIDVLAQDNQRTSRFDNVHELLPLNKSEFVTVVRGFERLMPLRKQTLISEDHAALAILWGSCEGYIGRLSNRLYDACQIAIESGEERLTRQILAEVPDRSIRAYRQR